MLTFFFTVKAVLIIIIQLADTDLSDFNLQTREERSLADSLDACVQVGKKLSFVSKLNAILIRGDVLLIFLIINSSLLNLVVKLILFEQTQKNCFFFV